MATASAADSGIEMKTMESDDDSELRVFAGSETGIYLVGAESGDILPVVVDKNFKSKVKLDYGNVRFLTAPAEDQFETVLAREGSAASCGSRCARGLLCCVGIVTPLVGWIALMCKVKYVKLDEVSLARGHDGNVYVLPHGCHLHGTLCRKVETRRVTEDVIQMNPVNILRILPGHYGIADNNGEPVILGPGRHFINDALFKWIKPVPFTDPHVRNGTTHIITVPGGSLGLVEVLGVGHILEPGRHIINNNDLIFRGFAKATDENVSILSKHRIMVPVGRIGLAWDGGDALLLNSDQVYYIDNNLFKYVGSVDILDEVIEHGSIKIITVNEGLLGIAFDDGELHVMEPGRHIIDKATFMFSAFLSTGQETLPIRQITSLSSDNVGLAFSAAFSIQVVDAKKAVTMLGRDLSGEVTNRHRSQSIETSETPFNTKVFQENIKDRARLNLSIIIGNNKFTDSFLSTAHLRGDASATDEDAEEQGESFKGLVHDAFMAKFATEMLRDCGVKILDMSIEDIKIVSKELSAALAQAAVKATELEMARIDQDVEVTRAATAMKSLQIRAEGEGVAKTIKAEAKSDTIRIIGDAEAARIRKIDDAMSSICVPSQRREMILSAAETLKAANSTLIFSDAETGNNILNGNMPLTVPRGAVGREREK
mmetsp:Transcript_37908/g.55878  ORF Transcript_37908/g.55878 Transcript_37908/m.55878 type:complete len:656 (+) Transcript_37908:75-2042(+)|eukprot:CAMPEP_0195513390 /NCGR_PEP_ID=MMETSP0794_2-20130614/5041_1 /TAXON_ID=515487 /ORGANISM="Stephanopyxis turris, Strain CCMP 815" /LENGTH=655 /DNA_ID=CAMNT_0040641383 /DNA_START=72 /DNA_END=2039 /DNA_ORIENTATION=-